MGFEWVLVTVLQDLPSRLLNENKNNWLNYKKFKAIL